MSEIILSQKLCAAIVCEPERSIFELPYNASKTKRGVLPTPTPKKMVIFTQLDNVLIHKNPLLC